MRKLLIEICVLCILFMCATCKKNNPSNLNFYNLKDRLGIWVNSERADTLGFINSDSLTRNYSFLNSSVQYNYRISGDKLYIIEPTSFSETEHSILELGNSKVKLGNMYITIEFVDNSGTFKKIK